MMIRLNREIEVRIRNLPLGARILVGLSGALAICIYGSVAYMLFRNHLIDGAFTETSKCPACYGASFCSKFKQGKVKLSGWSKSRLLDFANVKNIHYGWSGNTAVMLKKLGHDRDLVTIDTNICKLAVNKEYCDVSNAIEKIKILEDLTLEPHELEGLSRSSSCPSQRLLTRMVDNYKEKRSSSVMGLRNYANFLTTYMVNQEPLVIQAFPQKEGWPFVKYLGACGRYIVEEYVGDTLDTYYHATWEERIDLALQILQITDTLTENNAGFALYWTNIDYETFAVNSEGQVVIIDAENVIIVDKDKIKREKPHGWDEDYISKFEECPAGHECKTFKPTDLCTNLKSDHNYFMVCRYILSSYAKTRTKPGGLLHDLPDNINMEYNLESLLEECARPPNGKSRFDIKDQLLDILLKLKLQYF